MRLLHTARVLNLAGVFFLSVLLPNVFSAPSAKETTLHDKFFTCLYDNDFVCAENLILMARQTDSNDPNVWNLTGVLRFSQGNNLEAIDALRHAVRLDPKMSEARMFLGLAHKKAGLEQWQWVAENDPQTLEKYGHVFGIPHDWKKWLESPPDPFQKDSQNT